MSEIRVWGSGVFGMDKVPVQSALEDNCRRHRLKTHVNVPIIHTCMHACMHACIHTYIDT